MLVTNALRKFGTEIRRVRSLYVFADYAMRTTAADIQASLRAGNRAQYDELERQLSNEFSKGKTPFEVIRKARSQYPRYLREALLVRVVSALEVFFLDVVRELFIVRKDLFQTDARIEFTHGELLAADSVVRLWSRLLNDELRKLQNQGFAEISKFFKRRCQIDLTQSGVPIRKVEEIHERRHILVHRLGRVDKKYEHRYQPTHRNLSVPAEYFLDSLNTLETLAAWVDSRARALIEDGPPTRAGEAQDATDPYTHRLVIECLQDEATRALSTDFRFSDHDRILELRDILAELKRDGSLQILFLSGARLDVRAYVKELKKLERRAQLRIVESAVTWRKKLVCRLPDSTIDQIEEWLPSADQQEPHKSVAAQFGISRNQALAALQKIRDRKSTPLSN